MDEDELKREIIRKVLAQRGGAVDEILLTPENSTGIRTARLSWHDTPPSPPRTEELSLRLRVDHSGSVVFLS